MPRVWIVMVLIVAACGDSGGETTTVPPTIAPSSTMPGSTMPGTTMPPATTSTAPTTTSTVVTAPTFIEVSARMIDGGDLWAIPVWDGAKLVVSTEAGGAILFGAFNRDLAVWAPFDRVLDEVHTGGERIADHKHLFQGGAHYVAFSVTGADELLIARLDAADFSVELLGTVSTVPPTNDMVLFGDGERVYVGKFDPGTGHRVFVYDADLVLVDEFSMGGGPDAHANGAVALVIDEVIHLVAPDTLEPGANDRYRVFRYGLDGSLVEPGRVILEGPGALSLVTGLVEDPVTGALLLFYASDSGDGSGDIHMAMFDRDWRLLSEQVLASGSLHRPHAVLVGDELYVGYDSSDLTAHLLHLVRG